MIPMNIKDTRVRFASPFKRQPHKMVILKQFVGTLPTNCLSVFDHFVRLVFKGLNVTRKTPKWSK